jgi:hypothetical protein
MLYALVVGSSEHVHIKALRRPDESTHDRPMAVKMWLVHR